MSDTGYKCWLERMIRTIGGAIADDQVGLPSAKRFQDAGDRVRAGDVGLHRRDAGQRCLRERGQSPASRGIRNTYHWLQVDGDDARVGTSAAGPVAVSRHTLGLKGLSRARSPSPGKADRTLCEGRKETRGARCESSRKKCVWPMGEESLTSDAQQGLATTSPARRRDRRRY